MTKRNDSIITQSKEHNGKFVNAPTPPWVGALFLGDIMKSSTERCRKWRSEHPERQKGNDRKYRAEHRQQHRDAVKKYSFTHRKQRNEMSKKYQSTHPEKVRAQKLMRKFGINLDEYNTRFIAQNGVCAICKLPPANGRNLCVDHNHETDKVRGLLCDRCNMILGRIGESADILERMSAYLKKR